MSNVSPTRYAEIVTFSEDTPVAPPKPPRGVMRKQAPIKPVRSAIKIEPLENDDKENSCQNEGSSNNTQKFKATDTNEKMLTYFKRSIEVLRSSQEFTGAEAANILEAFILSNKDLFKREDLGRKNAVMVLDWWLKDHVFRSMNTNVKKFEDCDRTYYTFSQESDQAYFIANSPMNLKYKDETTSLDRSSRRTNSFKKFFSPLVRRNRSNSRGRNDNKEASVLKSTWSLFSTSDRNEKKAKQAQDQLDREEEAEIYELALFHLLNIIEVEFLEDVALPLNDEKKNVSFLSSIMDKMGLNHGEERLDLRKEDEMDLLIETHPLMRNASPWFQMARCCAPLLYLETAPGKSNVMQMYLWCKAALSAVSMRLEKMTHNGQSPLFPNEFAPLLSKIAQQLINDMSSGEKLNSAIIYLFLMVPSPLRTTIDNIVQWLQLTLRTDAVEDLRSPYYLGTKEPRHKENCKVIIDELKAFIFPRGCMTQTQQDIFIETMIELRNEKRLGKLPQSLANALKTKCVNRKKKPERRGMRRIEKHESAEKSLTPVRYAVANEGLRPKMDNNNKYLGLGETEICLVQMIETILDDKKVVLSEKKKRLSDFSKHYPILFNRFFSGLL